MSRPARQSPHILSGSVAALLIATLVCTAGRGVADAASIGVQFVDGGPNIGTALNPFLGLSGTGGDPNAGGANYNFLGGTYTPSFAYAGLKDSANTTTTAAITVGATGDGWQSAGHEYLPSIPGLGPIFNGGWQVRDQAPDGDSSSFTVSGVPYATYDLWVAVQARTGGDRIGYPSGISINGGATWLVTGLGQDNYNLQTAAIETTYTYAGAPGTNPGGKTINGNYVVYRGLSGNTTVSLTSHDGVGGSNNTLGSRYNRIFGLQIIDAPIIPTDVYWRGLADPADGLWSSAANFATGPSGGTAFAGNFTGSIKYNVTFNAANVTPGPVSTQLGVNQTIKTLTFGPSATGPITISGQTLTITPGAATTGLTVQAGSGDHTISSHVTLGADQIWTVADAAQTLIVSGNVTGAGRTVTKSGAGILYLNGLNTHTGGTTITQGIVAIAADTALGATGPGGATLRLGTGGTLVTTASLSSARPVDIAAGGGTIHTNGNNVALSGSLTGTGSLIKEAGGTLTLTGTSSNTATLTVNGGKLVGQTTSLKGNIVVTNPNNTVTFDQATAGSYTRTVSGAGSLVKDHAGTLTLTTAHTYTGGTEIKGGILRLEGSPQLPSIVGLQYHLDASAAGTVLGGTNVTAWNDLTANARNFTTNVGSPTYAATAFGSLPGILFGGPLENDRMIGAGGVKARTIIIVNKPTGYSDLGGIWAGQGEDKSLRIDGGNRNVWRGSPHLESDGGDGNDFTNINNAAGTLYTTTATTFDSNTEGFGGTGSAHIVVATGNYTPGTTALGGGAYSTRAYQGYIGEVLVYDSVLSQADRQGVETFLKAKWLTGSSGPASDLLPRGTTLTLSAGTTLELSSINQQLAALADAPDSPTGHQIALAASTLKIGNPLGDETTFTGAITATGASAVEKNGASIQNLDGPQGYDILTVAGGTLNLNGPLGSTPASATASVTVAPGAVLRFGTVSQTLSALTIGAGASVTFTSGTASGAFGGSGKDAGLGHFATIPEPGSAALLLTSGVLLLPRRRRAAGR